MALAPSSLDIDAVTSERQVFVSRHRIRSETHDQAMSGADLYEIYYIKTLG